MFKNEIHCNECGINFDGQSEIQYLEPHKPCCPRCASPNIVPFRIDGKIVEVNSKTPTPVMVHLVFARLHWHVEEQFIKGFFSKPNANEYMSTQLKVKLKPGESFVLHSYEVFV